jgi:chaperonin GroEL
MLKKTLYGPEARARILEGVNKITKAVAVTLGPKGRNCVIANSAVVDYGVHSFPPVVTKDGVTVAKAFDTEDPFEKVGVMMVKEAAQKTVDQAGDGTTTCCVFVNAIVSEGMKAIDNGANPIEVKRSIDKGVEYVVSKLKEMAVPVKGNIETIRQIATISANNDEEIGNWIAEAFEKIGEEGVIGIEASKGLATILKIAGGYKFDRGWVSPYFVNNKDKQVCEFENPLILLYDKRVTHHTQIQRALEISMSKGQPILIICEDASEEGLAFLAMNVIQGRVQCCVTKAPSFGELQRQEMEDIALLTGADYISDIRGKGIKEVKAENLGTARKVIVSKDETIIVDGAGNKEQVKEFLNELRMNLAQAKTEEEKFPIEKRIARLTGNVAVIQVGAATETEMKEKLDRFDDSVRATKAAISEGFVPGGGTAFFRVGESSDGIINSVLSIPLQQICTNAGIDPKTIIDQVTVAKGSIGYNAKTETIEDLIKTGVIDPVKVLRCALQNAASSAGMILTCESMIVDTL